MEKVYCYFRRFKRVDNETYEDEVRALFKGVYTSAELVHKALEEDFEFSVKFYHLDETDIKYHEYGQFEFEKRYRDETHIITYWFDDFIPNKDPIYPIVDC